MGLGALGRRVSLGNVGVVGHYPYHFTRDRDLSI